MKFLLSLFVSLFLCIAVHAQSTFINYPANGATVKEGKKLTVQLVRNDGLEMSFEAGVAIGIFSCPNSPCPPPDAAFGDIVFTGLYNPQKHEVQLSLYQNFTVTVPNFPGTAQLNLGRFNLIGAGPSPALEFHNLTIVIV